MVAFSKWCPPEEDDQSFSRAESAVNLALARMGQEKIALLQCKCVSNFFMSSLQSYLNLERDFSRSVVNLDNSRMRNSYFGDFSPVDDDAGSKDSMR